MSRVIELTSEEKAASDTATLVYALQAASFLVGLTLFVAVIINYVKRQDVQNTFVASHFRWQIRTFWFGLLWTVLGTLTVWLLIGWLILFANFIWFIYRIVRGWLALNDRKALYQ